MKLLTETKVHRKDSGAPEVKEWESAEHHLTHDGKNEFHARMLGRIKAAAEAAAAAKRKAELDAAIQRQTYPVSVNDLGFQMYALLPRKKAGQ